MPEVPDIIVFQNYLNATSLHQEITEVKVTGRKVLEEISVQALGRAVRGRKLEESSRHGKYLFAGTNEPEVTLLLHFGMTGFLDYARAPYGGQPDETAEHARVVFHFTNGYRLAYVNQRLLGKVGVVQDVERYARAHKLGPDVKAVSEEEFRTILSRGRGSIKSALMNQHMTSGLGNVYSDEALFQARIHPAAATSSLSEKEMGRLYRVIHEVIDTAVEYKADPSRLPEHFLLPRREPGSPCPGCGGEVVTRKISGRSSYFCPACQHQ